MILAWLATLTFAADELVFGEALAPNWYDWSWTSTVDLTATGDAHTGERAIFATLEGFGGLSIQRSTGFASSSALRFFVKGDGSGLVVRLESTGEGVRYEQPVTLSSTWTEGLVRLDALPAHRWDRISWVDTSGTGATLRVDDVALLDEDPRARAFWAVEPVGADQIVLFGAGSVDEVAVRLDGTPLTVASTQTAGGPTRTILTLDTPLTSGWLDVETPDGRFTRSLADATIRIGQDVTHVIRPSVYGANFPDRAPTAAEVERYGYGAVRWGGNARMLYNPATRTTNTGDDYYYLNVTVDPDLETWADWVGPDIETVVTVPNLDWVADGTQGAQFSVATYGAQEATAPGVPDAGNGRRIDGTPIDNDPADVCVPWDAGETRDWLENLAFTPSLLAIGNETDIAHIAHRGVHPDPATYDEQLQRFLDHANAAKDARPDVPVSGPVGCCWFYYWNSGDPTDAAAYGDFLPWFLDEVAQADAVSGRRTLDVLDLHYYPENLIEFDWKNLSDATIDRWRLRATRSLWDPTFVDDSWVGQEAPVTDQPAPDRVQLLPRMRALIDEHYPGTELAITEWSFGDADGISGGLATADALGIFGAQAVDWAFVWPTPASGSPTAAAFELYRGGRSTFGASSLPVDGIDPDRFGAYAALGAGGAVSIVVVNKSADDDLVLRIDGLDPGRLEMGHFGTTPGARVIDHPASSFDGTVTIPAYSAAILQVAETVDQPVPPPVVVDEPAPTAPSPEPIGQRCGGCTSGDINAAFWPILALVGWRRRSRLGSSQFGTRSTG